MTEKHYQLQVGTKTIDVSFPNWAEQANSSALIKTGDTVIFVSVVMGKNDREGIDYFPLMVNYEEKYYAAGKIYGSRFLRRESRPSETAILTSRLIDRTLRPLFSPLLRRDVQIVPVCLSIDEDNDPDILSVVASSVALASSDIPWGGPVSAVRIGWSSEKGFLINPSYQEREVLDLDMVIAGAGQDINMLEAGGKEVPEDIIKKAFAMGQEEIKKINEQQKKIIQEVGKKKEEIIFSNPDPQLENDIHAFLKDKLEKAIYVKENQKRDMNLSLLKGELDQYLKEKEYPEDDLCNVDFIFQEAINQLVHKEVLERERRPDGRKINEVRHLETAIDILPRVHGSALFERGATHVLSVVTLGSPADVLLLQGMEVSGEKRFMHHYNFPGYSSGEVAPFRGPGRREIGHGALGEKALRPLIPSKEDFPYTIRIVSEILSSNGSTSQGSICASSLSLMAAGVPIKGHVAGIAMGLMMDNKGHYKILTDIQGPEDHYGDMDFKAAGTRKGITALQMDVKVKGVTAQLLNEALDQAREARIFILDKMDQTIAKPKEDLSPYAPRIFTLQIPPDKIGALIGPGGKMIQQITKDTGVDIDIEDDGQVFVTGSDKKSVEQALTTIKEVTRSFSSGEVIEGRVVQIRDFGAIVNLGGNKEGLLHISELASHRVNKVEDVVHVGDKIKVKIKKVEANGRISLSLKDVKNYPKEKQK